MAIIYIIGILFFGIVVLASAFATLASIIRFEVFKALGFLILTLICSGLVNAMLNGGAAKVIS
jgi:hypothetical protein